VLLFGLLVFTCVSGVMFVIDFSWLFVVWFVPIIAGVYRLLFSLYLLVCSFILFAWC